MGRSETSQAIPDHNHMTLTLSRREVLSGSGAVVASGLIPASPTLTAAGEAAISDIVIVNGWVLARSDLDPGLTPTLTATFGALHDL